MKTVRLTMAQALVRFLENQYIEVDGEQSRFVRGVFIIPGHGNVVGLGQALSQEAKHLEIWHGQNEQGMAQAAVAFAKQMKRKQICVATSSVGPGAANMVTACGTATANNIPLLVLPGDVYACRQPDPVLQQVEQTNNLSISTNDAFKAVCRYWDRIVRPEQLMSAMISAFRVLTDPANTGAVCIAMPQDVEGEAYDYPESFFKKRVWRLERRPATEAALADAAEVIKKAKRPILVCGGGVRYSEAHEEFRAFAEATGIPFGETQAGKSAIEWTHPLNLGGLGVTGCSAANDIAKKADVVIGVGTIVNHVRDLARAYKEAGVAIEVGKVFDTEKYVINYENLGIGRLIYQLPTTLCEMFLQEVFKKNPIDALDKETLFTIHKFFENNLNVSETARKLFVHRNTLVYRLEKIKKLTGLDLREFDDAITFKVALMVKKYLISRGIDN